MNPASPPHICHFARRLLRSEGPPPPDGELAITFQRGCQSLHAALAPLITSAAFQALLTRALHLATREFPVLDGVTFDAATPCAFGPLPESPSAKTHPPADAVALILANLLWLLVTLLGTHLTVRAVKAAWPEVTTDEARSILHEGTPHD